MYLFSRSARFGPGNPQDQLAWSLDITEKVNQISELDVALWTTMLSPGVATLTWTTQCEELVELEAINDKLMADSGYLMLVEQGAKFSSGEAIDDAIVQVVYANEALALASPQYAAVVRSQLRPGALARGMEVGVNIAQRAEALSGGPTIFGVGATGAYGAVMWASTYDSIQALQRAEEAVNGDPSFIGYIDSDASSCFDPAVTTQTIFRRII
jgi:hypothetical protein